MTRLADLTRFYGILDRLAAKLGGTRFLASSHGRAEWPQRGVYFFFEPGEFRSDSGVGPRVVRVGTHALTEGSRTTLWHRLGQHRGAMTSGGGNHRGSIFRLLVGTALVKRDTSEVSPSSWGIGSDARSAAKRLNLTPTEVQRHEQPLELRVSQHIRAMPFLWVGVDDPPGRSSERGLIERNAIGLLSNFNRDLLDPPSQDWLGRCCSRERVRKSGLWNNAHVDGSYDAAFLDLLGRHTVGGVTAKGLS